MNIMLGAAPMDRASHSTIDGRNAVGARLCCCCAVSGRGEGRLRLVRVIDELLAARSSRKTNYGGAKTACSGRSSAASIELAVSETCAAAGATVAKKRTRRGEMLSLCGAARVKPSSCLSADERRCLRK